MSHRLARPRRAVPAIVTLALLSLTVTAAPTATAAIGRAGEVWMAQHSAPGGATGAALTCAVSTAGPMTFKPPLTLLARRTTARGAFDLTGCTSPTGTYNQIRRGHAVITGTGRASCTAATGVAGRGRVTWYDATGRVLGTSVGKSGTGPVNSHSAMDVLLAGVITQGLLKGSRVRGSVTPTGGLTDCTLSSVSSATGHGRVAFFR